jgi:hypothetical protein
MGWFEGMNLKIKRYYMDSKRKNTTPELMQKEARISKRRFLFRQVFSSTSELKLAFRLRLKPLRAMGSSPLAVLKRKDARF